MIEADNKTLWCGNLPEQVTEELLYELFLQAGPLEKVRVAKDRDGRQKNFAFITFCHEVSVPYAIRLFQGTALFHRTLVLQSRGQLAALPPPIRCYGHEPTVDFSQFNITQFSDMTEKLKDEQLKLVYSVRQSHDLNDKLVQASLQGNWSHRHHPYRPKEKPHRDNYRSRDKNNDYKGSRHPHSASWQDRRNQRKGGNYHHRRD